MSSVLQSTETPPLDLDDVVTILEENLHGIGFNKSGYDEQVYAVEVKAAEYSEIIMTMSDGSKFKLTVEEVS